jgi:hypothetical protein
MTMRAEVLSYSSWGSRVRKPSRVTRRLLRKPSTRQLRTVTSCWATFRGLTMVMPRVPEVCAPRISAPWQSRMTFDAVMSTPA